MAEIKCPKCGTSFKVDESGYTEILKQVRNEEFSKDLAEREHLLMEKHRSQIELLKKQSETEIAKDLNKKEQEIAKVREKALIEINKLKAQIATSEAENRLAISEAVNQAEKERDRFKNDLLLANEKAKNAEVAFMETSALSGENLEKAFEKMMNEVYKKCHEEMMSDGDVDIVGGSEDISLDKTKPKNSDEKKKCC